MKKKNTQVSTVKNIPQTWALRIGKYLLLDPCKKDWN